MSKKFSILMASAILSLNVLSSFSLAHADEVDTLPSNFETVEVITPTNIATRVDGSDSPSGAWQLKKTTVTKFTRLSQIDAANVKTKVYYRPINNVHMLVFY